MKRPRDQIEQRLLDLLQAIDDVHDGRRMQWAAHSDVAARVPGLRVGQLDALISVAGARGWLQSGGDPAHSLLLTAEGRQQILKP